MSTVLPIAAPATATATPIPDLTQAVNAARSASNCSALQANSLAEKVAQMATQNTVDYEAHRVSAVPFTDPMPALKTIGYTGSKAALFAGFGSTEADSIRGALIQGRDNISDCSLTQYGVSSALDDAGNTVTSVVMSVP
ncbi:MAG: hypothetical protein P4L48_09945 [Mycobacterium sp.]|nr:hypothetical protein [Mycobacterium sp.]